MGRKGFGIHKIIENKLKEGSITGEDLKKHVKKELSPKAPVNFDPTFEQNLIKVLKKEAGNIKIRYDPLVVDTRTNEQKLKVDSLRFDLDNKKHSKLYIHRLFKDIESDDITRYDKSMNKLLDLFEKKFNEYRNWENKILNQIKSCVVCLPYNEVIRELERIHEEELQFNDPSIDETIKEYIDIYVQRFLRGDPEEKLNKLNSFIERDREFMKEEHYTHLSFLNTKSCLENIDTLPPGFPKKRSEYEAMGSKGYITPEDYLHLVDVKTLPDNSINIEDIFYDLLFNLESHNTNIVRNTVIKCLSHSKTDKERLDNLKKFGVILKNLNYIEPGFMEFVLSGIED